MLRRDMLACRTQCPDSVAMSRAFNFSAGPAALPEPVLRQAQAELLEWGGERASVMEVSHRGRAFETLVEESEQDLRDLLGAPSNYRILFLQGGATQHFAQIPMNFATPQRPADYIVTGAWGQKAASEAAHGARVRIAASGEAGGFRSIPSRDSWQLSRDAAYVHYTSNETIHGVEFHDIPDVGDTPLFVDASSNILSRPFNISRIALMYAGAQKNIGPSGLVIMLVRDDMLTRCPPDIAKILNYSVHAANRSLLNTPPTFAWYLAGLVFKWLKAQGGVAAMGEINRHKAQLLYQAIDGSGGFYTNHVQAAARSWMNIPFTLQDASLDAAFLAESRSAGLLALKGHKLVGGMRASLYNAMPLDGVLALIDFMADFARRHG